MSGMTIGTWVQRYRGTEVQTYKSRFDLKCTSVGRTYITNGSRANSQPCFSRICEVFQYA